jgi:hypothetical protein
MWTRDQEGKGIIDRKLREAWDILLFSTVSGSQMHMGWRFERQVLIYGDYAGPCTPREVCINDHEANCFQKARYLPIP